MNLHWVGNLSKFLLLFRCQLRCVELAGHFPTLALGIRIIPVYRGPALALALAFHLERNMIIRQVRQSIAVEVWEQYSTGRSGTST